MIGLKTVFTYRKGGMIDAKTGRMDRIINRQR